MTATIATPAEQPESLMTPEQAAAYLGLSAKHLANLRCMGKGPRYRKLGASRSCRVRYRFDDLNKWAEER